MLEYQSATKTKDFVNPEALSCYGAFVLWELILNLFCHFLVGTGHFIKVGIKLAECGQLWFNLYPHLVSLWLSSFHHHWHGTLCEFCCCCRGLSWGGPYNFSHQWGAVCSRTGHQPRPYINSDQAWGRLELAINACHLHIVCVAVS